MMLLLLTQAVSGPVLPLPKAPSVTHRCPTDLPPDEIVVCARDPDSFRLKPLPDEPARSGLPKAEMRIGGAAVAAETEQATLAGGAQSQRLMVRLKVPFGGKRKQDGGGGQ